MKMHYIYCKFDMFDVTVMDLEKQMTHLMRKHPNFRLATIEIAAKTCIDTTEEIIVLEKKCENIEKIVKSRDVYYFE